MKKLILMSLMLVGIVYNTQAASFSKLNVGVTAVEAVDTNTPIVLTSLTLYSTNTSPTIVYLFDGPVERTIPAHTEISQYTTNIVSTYTTSVGTTNTVTNSALYFVETAVAEATVAATPVLALVVPANGELLVVEEDLPLQFGNYLTISNTAAGLNAVGNYKLR